MRLSPHKLTLFTPAIIGLSPAIIGAVVGASLGTASAQTPVDIVASNWKFTPATIQAHVGQATALNLTSSEGVHGIESADLGLAKTMIVPGKATAVTFTPKKAGTYAVHCAVICGAGHDTMILTVVVQ